MKHQRRTNAEKARESGITPRGLSEVEAAKYLGFSVATLQKKRTETPVRYTRETWEAELAKGRIVPPPYVVAGSGKNGMKLYDIRLQQVILGVVWIGAIWGAWKTYKESRERDGSAELGQAVARKRS
jgi:hypothetical protein